MFHLEFSKRKRLLNGQVIINPQVMREYNYMSVMTKRAKISDIAPCGMNCRLCIGYVRDKNKCDGCLTAHTKCSKNCTLRSCNKRKWKYCDSSCAFFPCTRLKNLDQRYRVKYGMSMLDNLEQIEELGIRQFVKNENTRWVCATCAELICVHRAQCLNCGTKRNAELEKFNGRAIARC